MSDIAESKQRDRVQVAAILLCALHHAGNIGDKSLQITVSGSAFNAVKLPKYIIEVYPAQKQGKGSGRKQTANKQSTPCSNCGEGKFLMTGESCLRCGRVYKSRHGAHL